jgi:hypothetical protein
MRLIAQRPIFPAGVSNRRRELQKDLKSDFEEIMKKRRKYDAFVVDLIHLLGYAELYMFLARRLLL